MTEDRLEWNLENWQKSMRLGTISKELGFPSKSLCFSSGGDSANDEFEIMCEDADIRSAEAMDSIIDSISRPQQVAVYFHWRISTHHYPTQALDYEEAKESIIKLANKRGLF